MDINDDVGDDPGDPFDSDLPPITPTKRQIEILTAYAMLGNPTRVAALLKIAISTVRNTLTDLHSKLGLSSSLQAFVYCEISGWITHDYLEEMRARIIQSRKDKRANG